MNKLQLTPALLDTTDATKLTWQEGEGLYIADIEEAGNSAWRNKHLYLASTREIKEGDWVLVGDENHLRKVVTNDTLDPYKYIVIGESNAVLRSVCRRIEFTTDPKLIKGWIKDNDPEKKSTHTNLITMSGVPVVPKSFLEEFVKRYNDNQKGIDVDNLETRKIVAAQQYALAKCGAGEIGSLTKVKVAWENGFETCQSLQGNPDKNFTLQDVIDICEKYLFFNARQEADINCKKITGVKDWIEQNPKFIQSLTKQKSEINIWCEMEVVRIITEAKIMNYPAGKIKQGDVMMQETGTISSVLKLNKDGEPVIRFEP